jgi:hypothetical protein
MELFPSGPGVGLTRANSMKKVISYPDLAKACRWVTEKAQVESWWIGSGRFTERTRVYCVYDQHKPGLHVNSWVMAQELKCPAATAGLEPGSARSPHRDSFPPGRRNQGRIGARRCWPQATAKGSGPAPVGALHTTRAAMQSDQSTALAAAAAEPQQGRRNPLQRGERCTLWLHRPRSTWSPLRAHAGTLAHPLSTGKCTKAASHF